MSKRLSFAIAIATTLALAPLAAAQSGTPQAPATTGTQGTATATVTGTVVSSSSTELVVETSSGRQRFTVDASSTIPRDIAPGTQVTVDYNRSDGGMQVTRVRVSGSGATSTTGTGRVQDPARDTDPMGADRDRDVLPATASPMGLIGLVGLASLAAAGALYLRRRVS